MENKCHGTQPFAYPVRALHKLAWMRPFLGPRWFLLGTFNHLPLAPHHVNSGQLHMLAMLCDLQGLAFYGAGALARKVKLF